MLLQRRKRPNLGASLADRAIYGGVGTEIAHSQRPDALGRSAPRLLTPRMPLQ